MTLLLSHIILIIDQNIKNSFANWVATKDRRMNGNDVEQYYMEFSSILSIQKISIFMIHPIALFDIHKK